MSGISGISSTNSIYGQMASGRAVSKASDGAAELSIIQQENTQITGLDTGANNMSSGKDLINVADSALGNITDSLQRMRELALSASNSALMTDSDKQSIQDEIDQLKQGISDIANQTTYNTKNILNGENPSLSIATDSNGNSTSISTANATLEALGIADFDVTGDFDIKTIDDALEKVSASRSSMGAQSNALDYAIRYNTGASLNLTSAKSKLEDLDYPQAVSEQKKQETLQTYSLMMQKKKMEDEQKRAEAFFTFS